MEPANAFAPRDRNLAAARAMFAAFSAGVIELFPTTDSDLVIAELRGDHQVRGSNARYRNHYLMFMRFRDGRVAHWREFSNPDVYRRATQGAGAAGAVAP